MFNIKKFFPITAALSLLICLGFSFTTPAKAVQLRTTPDTYNVGVDEIINDDLYIIESDTSSGTSTIEIAGTINGDLAITGGNILISGYITGNLYVAGGNIELSGNVEKSAYIAGGKVTISGHVGRDIYVGSGMLNFTGSVEEDLTVFAGQGTINGIISDDLRTSSGNITVSSTVGGDLITMAGTAITNEAVVTGETIVRTGETGDDSSFPTELTEVKETVTFASIVGDVFARILSSVGVLLVGFLFIWLMPVKTYAIAKKISGSFEDFIKDLGIGVVVIFMLPFIGLILMISQIGAPLGLLLFGLAFFITIFGSNWFDIVVGTTILKLLKVNHNSYGALSTGVLIRFIVSFIPIITFIYWLLTVAVATGAIIRMKIDHVKSGKTSGKDVTTEVKAVKSTKKSAKKK